MKPVRRCAVLLASGVALSCSLGAFGEESGTDRYMLTLDAAPSASAPAPVPAKDWMDEAKHPTPWLSWGADQRLRYEYYNNAVTLNEHKAGHEVGWGRFRTRLWADVKPCNEFEVFVRLNWEWRDWVAPESKPDQEWNQVTTDNLYAKIKPLPELTLTIGRQDIIKGDGWLILDGTPLDGSTTIYFDALRAAYEVKPMKTVFEGIFIQQYASPDHWLPTINDTDHKLMEQNERGAIFYVTNNTLKSTQLEMYFIYKNDRRVLANGDQGEIYTFGGRVVHQFTENISARAEGAGQFGRRNDAPLCAFGVNSRATYAFNDTLKNTLFLNFEMLSGDDPNTHKNEAFDPLWGRWPQFSELIAYNDAGEKRPGETSNLIRAGGGYSVYPVDQVQLELGYNALFANENTRGGANGFNGTGDFRGHLLTAILRYKMNEHLSAHLWGEFFMPGNYYDGTKGDDAAFLRAEVILTF
jgi:hypothetical protein